MNYIRELNAFVDWLETNPLDPTTQALWFHLMAIANKCGWPEWFAVANLTLQAKLGGIDKATLAKHRNILSQKGLIEYKSRGTREPGLYKLHSVIEKLNQYVNQQPGLDEKIPRTVNRSVNQSVTNPTTNPGDIKDKLNETKPKTAAGGSSSATSEQDIEQAYQRVVQFCHTNVCAMLSPLQYEMIRSWLTDDGLECDLVLYAFEKAVMANKRRFDYVRGIIRNWLANGIRTKAQALAEDEEYRASKDGAKPQMKVKVLSPREKEELDRLNAEIAKLAASKAIGDDA
ncbi:MAG: DnaD domain-containing protein [Bacillota bacterium]